MLFNKRFNNILNIMFRNCPETRHYFTKFFNSFREDYMEIVNERINQEYYDDGIQIATIFEPLRSIIEISEAEHGYIKLDLCLATKDVVAEIPEDPENDIFLDNEYGDIFSPIFLNFVYSPYADEDNEMEDLDYLFYVVKKKDGYYLVSQEINDAGIHCTKIELDDFIVPENELPQKLTKTKKKKIL